MADFTYKNTSVQGAATLEEAKELAVVGYLRQFGEPTQQEINDLLAEIEAEEVERLDLEGLEDDITDELAWITTAIAEVDTGLGAVDAATLAQLRVIVKGLLQNQRRVLLQQRGEFKAWRYVVRRFG
jgi:hypothetical protein